MATSAAGDQSEVKGARAAGPLEWVRRWWQRERPTGVALFLFGVRWAAWGVAAFIVTLDILPETNVQREPVLLFVTLAENAAVTLYLPLMRPYVRSLLRRWVGEVNDILVMSLIDLSIALGIVHLSGGWDSPYYLYAVSSLLVTSSIVGLRANLLLAVGFVGTYIVILATAGEGVDGPWLRGELNNFIVFLATPFLVAIVVQFFAWMARQLAAERETARQALAENIRLQEEREQLVAQEERSRIAREIHDGIAQSIYMLSLNLETAADMATAERGLSDRLGRLVTLAKQTLLEVRHYIFDLKPLLRGEASVSAALQSQMREFTAVSGLPVRLEVAGEERPLSVAAGTALYRIAQEALANVYRHAQASQIGMRLSFDDRSVCLEVCDNGVGFSTGEALGRGLRNMQQRAQELGGEVTIESAPGKGTTVRAKLPAGEA
jgi:signal transduction histidine kinase